MKDKLLGKQLLELETKYWQAVQDKDIETALSLTDDPCIVVGSRGVQTVDREKFREMMRTAKHTLRSFKLTDAEERSLGDNVGILAYKVREEMVVDDQPLTIEAAHSSTWTKKDGRWVCSLHTESIAGDPFGRDRRAA